MNILFIVPYVPNLIRVRPYNLIRHLSERGHRVTVQTLWTGAAEQQALEGLRAKVHAVSARRMPAWHSLWNCLMALPTGQPLQSVYSWHAQFSQQMGAEVLSRQMGAQVLDRQMSAQILDRQMSAQIIDQQMSAQISGRVVEAQVSEPGGTEAFDVVHVEHLRGARYGLDLRSRLNQRGLHLPVVWDSVDSISHLFRQAAAHSQSPISRGITRLELGRTQRYERWLACQFERVLVSSPADRQAFLSLDLPEEHADAISILPNGVDLEYFRPDGQARRDPATIVVSGKMSYHANVTMALHLVEAVMPHVWRQIPEARVVIVGKDPPAKIQALGQHPNITVTGTVEDIRPYLQTATLAAAPIAYGAGIQNKVLEAMACATPVVATPQAVQALQAQPGQELVVAQEPEEIAEQVIGLLRDPDRQRRLGQAGLSYVQKYHRWPAIAAQLEEIYAGQIGLQGIRYINKLG